MKTQSSILAEGNPIERLIAVIEEFLIQNNIKAPDAISIGAPASISSDRKSVYCAPNLKSKDGRGCLDRQDIVTPLSEHFGCLTILNKDVNNLLYCDLVEMGLLNCNTVAAGYVGTGLGGALYIRGEIQYGIHCAAMDIGHLSMHQNSARCNCGKIGCAETLASGQYLQKIRRTYFPTTSIDEIFVKHSGEEIIRAFLHACAESFAIMLTYLDPDVTIVGGGVAQMSGFPFDDFKEMILELASPIVASHDPDIRLSPDLPEKGVLGAAYYAMDVLKKRS